MEAVLEAQTRESFGKNEARRTRREGKVPAVLYGGDGKGATPISVAPKALLKILHSEAGQNTLIALKLNGQTLDLDHGYPCRLIAPTRPGVLQTKWLSRIEVVS